MIRKSTSLNLGTGAFVVLGFATLFFLTTQTTSRGMSFRSSPHYDVTARFDNIGDLRVGAPVSMAGVEIGRVFKIDFDTKDYKAVVNMQLNAKYNQIPSDSDAAIGNWSSLGRGEDAISVLTGIRRAVGPATSFLLTDSRHVVESTMLSCAI